MFQRDNRSFYRKKRPLPNQRDAYDEVPSIEFEDQREEKPWQRVVYQVTKKGPHLYEPVKSVPCWLLILVLGIYLLLGYFTQLVEDHMPRVLTINEVGNQTDKFSEESAWAYMSVILGDQPRVAGTRYHLTKTVDMKDLVDDIAAKATIPVRTDWQLATDDYWLAFDIPFVNYYQNVSNIIAVLEGESGFLPNGTIGTSLLLNCHYDSVPYALGASDNAAFCAIMVEVLSRLSQRSVRLKHNVVFLFNGAEENPLQGSHAFLSHPWARGVTNVVNLDACGMNGKAIIFQVTDPRVLAGYKRTSYLPNGHAVGEFMFTAGVIPSDTDFRIFRDFADLQGIDIAFVKHGSVYHTRNDRPELLQTGVLQAAGDMLLQLVADLADNPELAEKKEPSAAIYYDYLNVFLITYSLSAAAAVDVLIAMFGLITVAHYLWLVGFRMSSVIELLYSALGRVVSTCAGILVMLVLVPIMVATTTQLRYLSAQWVLVPQYWLPYFIAAVSASQAFDAWRTKKSGLNRSIRTLQAFAATRLLFSVYLLVLACVPQTATIRYVLSVPLFILSATSIISITFIRYFRFKAWEHLLLELLLSLPGAMFAACLALRLNALMVPTLGRTPSDAPDYTVAAINVGLAVLVASTLSGMELLFSRRRLWIIMSVLGLISLVFMFVHIDPYRDEESVTQRHHWFHTEIVSYNRSLTPTERVSGVLITKHDANALPSTLQALASGPALTVRSGPQPCESQVHCNLPLYRPRFGTYLSDSLFVYMGPPDRFDVEPQLQVTTRSCEGEICHLRMTMIGSAHNTITVWPRPNVNLTSWTFSPPLLPSFTHLQRPVYMLIHSTATYSEVVEPLEFGLTFQVPLSLQSQVIADVSHHAHKIYHPEEYSVAYRSLVEAMPKYFNIASYMSLRSNYEI